MSELALYDALGQIPEPHRTVVSDDVIDAAQALVRQQVKAARRRAFRNGFLVGAISLAAGSGALYWARQGKP